MAEFVKTENTMIEFSVKVDYGVVLLSGGIEVYSSSFRKAGEKIYKILQFLHWIHGSRYELDTIFEWFMGDFPIGFPFEFRKVYLYDGRYEIRLDIDGIDDEELYTDEDIEEFLDDMFDNIEGKSKEYVGMLKEAVEDFRKKIEGYLTEAEEVLWEIRDSIQEEYEDEKGGE